jgi:hypothetical protein
MEWRFQKLSYNCLITELNSFVLYLRNTPQLVERLVDLLQYMCENLKNISIHPYQYIETFP